MDPFFLFLERSSIGLWVREEPSMWAFPFMLILHAIGMGFLAGTNIALDLRLLGVAKDLPLKAFGRFFPLMWFGLVVNALSGLALLLAYPAKALTNPVFYLKLGCIAVALVLLRWMRGNLFGTEGPRTEALPRAKTMAAISIALWATAVTAGRLLAYTHTRLLTLD